MRFAKPGSTITAGGGKVNHHLHRTYWSAPFGRIRATGVEEDEFVGCQET
jgi:hypothetical protein